jgi:hypothetical protein
MVVAADILMLGLGMKYAARVVVMGVLFLASIVIRHRAARLTSLCLVSAPSVMVKQLASSPVACCLGTPRLGNSFPF